MGIYITETNEDRVKWALLAMQRYSWEQGVAMMAFLEQGDIDIVTLLAKEAVYRRSPDGRLASMGNQTGVTDSVSMGEALRAAIEHSGGDPDLEEGYDAMLDYALNMAPRSSAGIVYHVDDKPQFWVDSLYMLPPVLAAAGHYGEALLNLYGYWDALFDRDKKLLSHIWDDGEKKFVRRAFWGVGNGWAMAGCARVYDLLGEEHSEDKKKIASMAKTIIDSLVPLQRPDGFFHDVVDDPSTFVETNLAQMFAYTVYRGLASCWLEESCLARAEKARAAANSKVDKFGLVRDVCGAPGFDKPGVAPEGQSFYLLMEAAARKYFHHEPESSR
jgi:rhamnogalacturonyl hydrolase YesR